MLLARGGEPEVGDVVEQARARLKIEDEYGAHLEYDVDAEQAAMALMSWIDIDGHDVFPAHRPKLITYDVAEARKLPRWLAAQLRNDVNQPIASCSIYRERLNAVLEGRRLGGRGFSVPGLFRIVRRRHRRALRQEARHQPQYKVRVIVNQLKVLRALGADLATGRYVVNYPDSHHRIAQFHSP